MKIKINYTKTRKNNKKSLVRETIIDEQGFFPKLKLNKTN
jgi:hypothetical protein